MTGPRIYCPLPLSVGLVVELPAAASKHVQVLRLQPGSPLNLFNGQGGEYAAQVLRMGRSSVTVEVGPHHYLEREITPPIDLAVALIANERMDWLIEKATELGARSVQPLLCERTVVSLNSERAEKKRLHWQAIAVAACAQCGRNRIPPIHAPQRLLAWLSKLSPANPAESRILLSLREGASPWKKALEPQTLLSATVLSGPEGGLTPAEEDAAQAQGFCATRLHKTVLRAETAPLAALAALAVHTYT